MSSIYNFHQVNDRLACAGQPRENQLAWVAAEGYKVVINLALADGKYVLADEAGSVATLGLKYYHIPVQFDNPQLTELAEFIKLMKLYQYEKTLVHCAANYRASVFTGLYLFTAKQLDEGGVQLFVEEIWQPDGIWQQFLEEGLVYLG
jgi:protein tyrosine phosphatase (PTP) superfamily phosphohydrolase (DUF442 family)